MPIDEYTRELTRKAANRIDSGDIAVGGVLVSTQAQTFFEKMILEPTLLSQVRVEIMPAPSHEVPKLGMSGRLMEKATEATAATGTKPTFSKITLSANEIKGEVDLSRWVLEDNIEKDGFADRLVSYLARCAARDVHELMLLSDPNSGDTYLTSLGASKGGVLWQLNGGNVCNAEGQGVGSTAFKNALKTMPEQWRGNEDALRFYVSKNQVIEYRELVAKRMTGLGDAMVTGRAPVYSQGVEVQGVTHMPSTQGLLIDPKNIIVGFHREVLIETDYDVKTGVWFIVLSLRLDVQLEETEAAVRIDNLAAA